MKPKDVKSKDNTVDLCTAIAEFISNTLSLDDNDDSYFARLSILLSGIEKEISFEKLTRARTSPKHVNFRTAARNSNTVFDYCKVMAKIIQRLTIANKYDWNDDQLFSCSIDMFYLCVDWNMGDMVHFVYHVRTNPHKRPEFVKNGPLLPIDLMNMVAAFNDMRAAEHERLAHTLEKEKSINQNASQVVEPVTSHKIITAGK